MRYALFAVLALVPLVAVSWVAWRGQTPRPEVTAMAAAPDAGPPAAPASQPAAPADPDAALRALFAEPLAGARPSGDVALYDAKTLFDYINGAAPLFIDRRFRRLAAAELVNEDGSELTCDVYDMTDAASAESIFAKERSPTAKEAPGWPQAVVGPMSLVFHHDRFYVKLTAFDARAEARLLDIAGALKGRLR